MKARAGEKLEYGDMVYRADDGKLYRAEEEKPVAVPSDGVSVERWLADRYTNRIESRITFNRSPVIPLGTPVEITNEDGSTLGPFAVVQVSGTEHTAVNYGWEQWP